MNQQKIAIIGLGYVGLPLAVAFAKKRMTIGFDINSERVDALKKGNDRTDTIDKNALLSLLIADVKDNTQGLHISSNEEILREADIYIITVPTPVDSFKVPDLSLLLSATRIVAQYVRKGSIVIYESTVYPGCTEEACVPIIEQVSGLKFNRDFFVGFSPERINPGDKVHTFDSVIKVTSGSTPETAQVVDDLYKTIVKAGTHKAPCIKVAEAAKAIENAQRDVNISFVNELSLIFDRMGIDTQDVLEAAGTKWNFMHFQPGLVGGHCIGVDPYYLAHKASQLGYDPQVILSGRRVNDHIPFFIVEKVIKLMAQSGLPIKGAKALILGITFKENCPDIRNSKIADIYHELCEFGLNVEVYDPIANADEVRREYGIHLLPKLNPDKHYDTIVVAVAHSQFKSIDFKKYKENNSILFDVKAIVDRDLADGRL